LHKVVSCVRFPALGSTALVMVTDRSQLQRARAIVEETVAAFDYSCSRFRADSELTALNEAGGAAVRVSQLLLDAVDAAVRAAVLTDGAVDPSVGRALMALGYDRDFARIPTDPALSVASVPGWRAIKVDRHANTITIARGTSLDLGATAKALAADRGANAASDATGCGVLVSLGGDISTAGSAPSDGWRIRVTDDHRSGIGAPGQWITLGPGGLATSSKLVRQWRTARGPMHHLVDPTSGRPAGGIWRTASVAAASCLDANIASTAALVRQRDAVRWLEVRGLPSRLVDVDGRARHLAGWPTEGDDLI
jgi:FAD:protein FMN transferase